MVNRTYGTDEVRKYLAIYERYNVAQRMLIGLPTAKGVMMVAFTDVVKAAWCYIEDNTKGNRALFMRLHSTDAAALLNRKGVAHGDVKDIYKLCPSNKGDAFEWFEVERYTGEQRRTHNSVPFYKEGDFKVQGDWIQVKLNGAQLAELDTLDRLDREGR